MQDSNINLLAVVSVAISLAVAGFVLYQTLVMSEQVSPTQAKITKVSTLPVRKPSVKPTITVRLPSDKPQEILIINASGEQGRGREVLLHLKSKGYVKARLANVNHEIVKETSIQAPYETIGEFVLLIKPAYPELQTIVSDELPVRIILGKGL